MRALLLFVFASFLCVPAGRAVGAAQVHPQALGSLAAAPLKPNEVAFMYFGSSTVIIKVADQLILVDPADCFDKQALEAFKTSGVTAVLYTHGHGDHFHLDKALQIYARFKPFVVCEPALGAQFKQKIPEDKMIGATPGKPCTAGRITVDTVTGKHPGGVVMYRMTIGDVTIFHGADSGYVSVETCPAQIAFVPAGGASPTASPEDAARMVADVKPQIAVVFHGNDKQYAAFKTQLGKASPKIKVLVPKAGMLNKLTLEPAGSVPARHG